ncbi:DNA polymerase III subunit delta [Flavobacteriaceae bacterium]|nr:DNA polymerase III subunit delta [Flavobacteriaceae bacterium]
MKAFFSLLSKIEKNQFSPLYLLSGTEPFYIDTILKALTNKLVHEESKAFDFSQFYGKDTNVNGILESVKRYPMISKFNVVVVKEAQLLNSIEFDHLASYAQNPLPQSILIICYKNKIFDKRKKLYKAIDKNGDLLTVKPIYENQLNPWIENQAKNLKINISPVAIELLTTHVGSNLSSLDNELKKLKLLISEDVIITEDHIEKHVGISKKFNSFELQKAIGLGRFSRAFQIIQYLNINTKENPLILTLGNLHNYFQKLLLIKGVGSDHKTLGINPFFINEYKAAAKRFNMRQITLAMDHVMEADLKSKGINSKSLTSKEILEELLLKLFNL